MAVTVHNLGSGSSGNALAISVDGRTLLVDCGLSPRAIRKGLADAGVPASGIVAIAVTHEHGDHVRGLEGFDLPVLASGGTLDALGIAGARAERLGPGRETAFDGFAILPIRVSHDAAEPCGFAIAAGGVRIVVCTDLGRPEPALAELLPEADLIVLEANYDPHMLASGPYPAHLKRRIRSGSGHLSNEDCGRLLGMALARRSSQPTVWLAHLSRTNNRPEIAREHVSGVLESHFVSCTVEAMRRGGMGQRWAPGERPATQLGLGL